MKKITTLLTTALLGSMMLGAGQVAFANAGDDTNPLTLTSDSKTEDSKKDELTSNSDTDSSTESSTESTGEVTSESSTETSTETSTDSSGETTTDQSSDELPETGDNTTMIGGIALGASATLFVAGLAFKKRV